MDAPLISVVLCTWNRAPLLDGALAALAAQVDAPPHEIIVVNNASTDGTADLARRWAARAAHIRAVDEPRPGLSFARNRGIAESAGRLLAFTDDDVRVHPRWLANIAAVAADYPEAACYGGPVTPAWQAGVPAWLTERQWAPLGVQDYGDVPLRVDSGRPLCLIGANLIIRRHAFDSVGGFSPDVQRVGDRPGSTEDHAWHVRLWAGGGHGLYHPALRVTAIVEASRLRKRHHRRWHYGHGRHVARMRLRDIEGTHASVFGVPGHVLRQAAADGKALVLELLRRDPRRAFEHEARLWFAAGFLRERWV